MAEVIPAVLEQEWSEIQKKVRKIKKYTDTIQLDVMDGIFVPNTTFNDTDKLKGLNINLELHLMIDKPSLHLRQWLMDNVTRVIVHYEAVGNLAHVIKMIKDAGKEAAVAINPPTSTHELREYLDDLDMVLVMGVDPGFSGQSFNKDVLEKIKELKAAKPDLLVEVDGGVNEDSKDAILEAGADILAAASYIWKSKNIKQAIKSLQG